MNADLPPETSPIPATPPHISLNRVTIVDLPGCALDDEVRGQRAGDLLSAAALGRYALAAAADLRLPPAFAEDTLATRRGLPVFVDACLISPDPAQRAAAEALGRRLGRNLGHLLLALRRGDAVNRAARAEWGPEEWTRWGRVQQVWLGGGLLSGRLGARIVAHARSFLAETGSPEEPRVAASPWGRELPLLGAARYLPAGAGHALCLDFGHTAVKRACVRVVGDAIREMHTFPPVDIPLDWQIAHAGDRATTGRWLLAFMAETVAGTAQRARAAGLHPRAEIMVAVASYVDGGRLPAQGFYTTLMALADDARPLLAGAIAELAGSAPRVRLIHDGTAAAACHAGAADTVVIVAGTALGLGFPPATAAGLRKMAWNGNDQT